MIQPIASDRSPEWRQLRSTGIGASEAAAACGVSPWCTALEVWSRKVNPAYDEPNDAMLLGTLMEPVIATFYMRKTGREIKQLAPGLYRHPEVPCVLASPDAWLTHDELAEWKSTTHWDTDLGEPGTDEVPIDWLCQAQQQLAVTGAKAVRFGVLIDGREFREYVVERHSHLIDKIIQRDVDLWNHVVSRTPPPIDWSHSTACEAVRRAYMETRLGEWVTLPPEAGEQWEEYEALGRVITDAESTRKLIAARLISDIKNAEGGLLPDGTSVKKITVRDSVVPSYTRKGYCYLRKVK